MSRRKQAALADAPPRPQRFRRGKGTPYVPDVVARVRVLVERTVLPEAEIATRMGIGVATVNGWKVRRGWTRPPGAAISVRAVSVQRAGFTRRMREAFARLEALAVRESAWLSEQVMSDPEAVSRVEAVRDAAQSAQRRKSRGGAPQP